MSTTTKVLFNRVVYMVYAPKKGNRRLPLPIWANAPWDVLFHTEDDVLLFTQEENKWDWMSNDTDYSHIEYEYTKSLVDQGHDKLWAKVEMNFYVHFFNDRDAIMFKMRFD